jgi:hypothetical protein
MSVAAFSLMAPIDCQWGKLMNYTSENVATDVSHAIGALELPKAVVLGESSDAELESSVFMGPPPTQSLQCPTVMCNFTRSGCH